MAWREEDDELDEAEDSDESDQDGDENPAEVLPCPHCGEEVYEEADRCPHCGEYITPRITTDRKPWWIIIAAILALLAVLLWLAF